MNQIEDLFHAINANCASKVSSIVSNIPDIQRFTDLYQKSPLCLAIENECLFEVVEQLVNSKINLNDGIHTGFYRSSIDNNPLVIACKKRNLKVMKLLIEKGAIVEVNDCFDNPILHHAVKNGIDYVKLLISNGVDPTSIDSAFSRTALHIAIKADSSYELVNYLLRCGVDTYAKDFFGDTAVALSLKKENLNPAIRIMLQTTMAVAQKKKKSEQGFSKSVKRKFILTEPDTLKDDAEKCKKKLRSNECTLSNNFKKKEELERKRVDLLKSSIEARKKAYRYIDDGKSLFGVKLDCPICLEDFVSGCPIYQCHNGHLLCALCHTRFTLCPQCNVKTTDIRNRALESLIEGMNS